MARRPVSRTCVTLGAFLFAVSALPQTSARFEVASIKLNTACGSRRNGGSAPSPGRADMNCTTLEDMIRSAYGRWAHGPHPDPKRLIVSGAPAWLDSDLYDMQANAEAHAPLDQMYGPMLQALLEDRFKLKVHWEEKELPVYALTVAKGGIKMASLEQGSCLVFDINHLPPPAAPGEPVRKFCGRQNFKQEAGAVILDASGMSLRDFTDGPLSSRLDRPVIDRTGLAGMFDFHLEFSPGTDTPDVPAEKPSIFTALQQQLGLKLEATKGPVRVLVIDHVERPTPN